MSNRAQQLDAAAERVKGHRIAYEIPMGTPFWWKRLTRREMAARMRVFRDDGRLRFTRFGVSRDIRKLLAEDEVSPLPTDGSLRNNLFTALDHKLNLLLQGASPPPPQTVVHRLADSAFITGEGMIFKEISPRIEIGDYIEIQFAISVTPPFSSRGYFEVVQITPDTQDEKRYEIVCCYATSTFPEKDAPLPEPEQQPEPSPQPEPAPTPAQLAEQERQKRQAYRVNDDVLFRWRVIREGEFNQIERYYKANNRNFPPLRHDQRFDGCVKLWEEVHVRFRASNPKAHSPLAWLFQQIKLIYLRSNHPQELDFTLEVLKQVLEVAELHATTFNSNRINEILGLLKRKLEFMIKRDQAFIGGDGDGHKKMLDNLLEVEKRIAQVREKLELKENKVATSVHYLSENMNRINLSDADFPEGGEDPNAERLLYPVNISATGIAYRTHKKNLAKGSFAELHIDLSDDGKHIKTWRAFAKLVMIQGPDPSMNYRVASMLLLQPPGMEDAVMAHILRKQRELIAAEKGLL
ncbi:hypothetical protein Mmc1_1948 [Magnetococcus marinus MC-1]|uniref:PilZ domain-containing protein n=1 Tax=Magnetococcus marinus (strain ATCC BAA-1437 / JCM 17883 / MC-1) TaxID=156889 RepID=A0L913_MAGMM|nr:hypothetical protein [Magnetococcus marinus]ABK44456.1 hypothetical protein Mmc1_1948 [Magnetococcus marinus MC-1]